MDIDYLLFLQNFRVSTEGVLDIFFLTVTDLATLLVTFLLFALVYWCVDKKTGAAMGWNIAVACSINAVIKRFFNIPRPWLRDSRIQPVEAALADAKNASFPSGHTTRTTAAWGTLGFYLWGDGRQKSSGLKKILSVICWIIVPLVMFSRNYLGVHTPQDVMVAFLLGIAIILSVNRLLYWADANNRKYDLIIVAVAVVLCIIPMIFYGPLANCGTAIGVFLGWYEERRWINFEVSGNVVKKVIRFLLGAAVIAVLLTFAVPVLTHFMKKALATFLTYMLIGFFIMAIYPLVFKKVSL